MPGKATYAGLTAALLAIAGAGSFTLMAVKDQSYVPSPNYAPVGEASKAVAIVYYSRSGHSEAVAREIASIFNAPIARIIADYPLSFSGQRKAVADADTASVPAIKVQPRAPAPAQRLFLVSPTWMFRPAPPLWAYVKTANLKGLEVVLVTTGNSRFKQSEIDAFAHEVALRGGRMSHHIFLRRGRIYWQKSREQLLQEVRSKVRSISPEIGLVDEAASPDMAPRS